jgi:phosphohistidine swiveling domain-containing protein
VANPQSGVRYTGVSCGQPERVTRTASYATAVREPDSDCDEASVLTRDHESDDFVDNLSGYELSANMTRAASVTSTAAIVTSTPSLGEADPVLCARRLDDVRRSRRPPPLVRPPRLPAWLQADRSAAHRTTAGPPRSAEKAQEQVFGTTDALAQPSPPTMHNRFQSYDDYVAQRNEHRLQSPPLVRPLPPPYWQCNGNTVTDNTRQQRFELTAPHHRATGRPEHVRRALRFDERKGWSY